MMFWPTSFYNIGWMINIVIVLIILLKYFKWTDAKIGIKWLIGVCCLIGLTIFISSGFNAVAQPLTAYGIGVFIFKFKPSYKKDLLLSISKWFGIILGISLIAFILWLILPIPPVTILSEPFGYMDHANYIFFIRPFVDQDIVRFSGPFIEPGHVGMIGALFLYANRFNFKNNKLLILILLGVLFSLSLAGYVLLVLGYWLSKGMSLTKQIILVVACLGLYITITDFWAGGNNPINEQIFSRLEYDNQKGIKGNNRSLNSSEEYLSQMIINGDILVGIGTQKYEELERKGTIGGTGITLALIMYGIFGIMMVLIYYLTIALLSVNRKYALKFFLLIVACYLQRSYPHWLAWLVPYITGTGVLSSFLMMPNKPHKISSIQKLNK